MDWGLTRSLAEVLALPLIVLSTAFVLWNARTALRNIGLLLLIVATLLAFVSGVEFLAHYLAVQDATSR